MGRVEKDCAGSFVDGQDRTHQALLVGGPGAQREREQQTRRGQTGCAFAEVFLVELQRRSAVEFVQHVADAARHATFWAEDVPAVLATVADANRIAAEADGTDQTGCGVAMQKVPGRTESATVTRQSASDQHARRQDVVEAANQHAAVDQQAIG